MHHLLQDSIFLQVLKLFLGFGFGIFFTPLLFLAFFCLFLALIFLFPAFCVFFFALLLLKILLKNPQETDHKEEGFRGEQDIIEIDSSEFSFGSFGSSDSKDSRNHGFSETDRLNKHLDLWRHWNPDSVEIPRPKPFHELLSFWRRLEKTEVKQRDNQVLRRKS